MSVLILFWLSQENHAKAFASTVKPIPGRFASTGQDSLQRKKSPVQSIRPSETQKLSFDSDVSAESFVAEVHRRQLENMTKPLEAEILPRRLSKNRFCAALPGHHSKLPSLDRKILSMALPSMLQMAVVPLVAAVDTYWAGRSLNALALAGQSAANQVFFTFYFLVASLPTLTAPMIAKAVGSGKSQEAKQRICESLFLSNISGCIVTLFLASCPQVALRMVLQNDAPAMLYATPYLRLRALGAVPALVAATGFAAYRGMLDTIPPLKVSLATNFLNLILNPLFAPRLGLLGVAAAKIASESTSGLTYLILLLRKKLASVRRLWTPPSLKSLIPLVKGGLFVLIRQVALNVGMVMVARRAQALDPATGFSAAAYEIVMQLYNIGVFCHLAMQGTAAALVPSVKAQKGSLCARTVADRLFVWNTIVGIGLGLLQWFTLPLTIPMFTSIPEVQQAVRIPALISSIVLAVNGVVFAGEGILMGLGHFRDLMWITVGVIASQACCLSIAMFTKSLVGIFASLLVFKSLSAVFVLTHHLRFSDLARIKAD